MQTRAVGRKLLYEWRKTSCRGRKMLYKQPENIDSVCIFCLYTKIYQYIQSTYTSIYAREKKEKL